MLRNNKKILLDVRKILSNNQQKHYQMQTELFRNLLHQHSDTKYFTCYRPFYYLEAFDPGVQKKTVLLNCYIVNRTDDLCYYVDIGGKATLFDNPVIGGAIERLKKLLKANNIQPGPVQIMERLDDTGEHVNIKEAITNLLSYFPGHKILAIGKTYLVNFDDQDFDVSLSHQVLQENTESSQSEYAKYPSYSVYEPHSIQEGKSQADAYHNIASFNLISGYFGEYFQVYQREKTRRLKVQYGTKSEQFKELEERFSLLEKSLSLKHLRLSKPVLSEPSQPEDSLVLQSMAEFTATDLRKLIHLDLPFKLNIAKLVVKIFARLHGERLVHCDVTPANILVDLKDGEIQGLFIVDPDDIRPFFKVNPANPVHYTPGYYLDSDRHTQDTKFDAQKEQYAVAISLLEFLTGLPIDLLTLVNGVLTEAGLSALNSIEDDEMRSILVAYTNRGPEAVIDIQETSEDKSQLRESPSKVIGNSVQPMQISPNKRGRTSADTTHSGSVQPMQISPNKRSRASADATNSAKDVIDSGLFSDKEKNKKPIKKRRGIARVLDFGKKSP